MKTGTSSNNIAFFDAFKSLSLSYTTMHNNLDSFFFNHSSIYPIGFRVAGEGNEQWELVLSRHLSLKIVINLFINQYVERQLRNCFQLCCNCRLIQAMKAINNFIADFFHPFNYFSSFCVIRAKYFLCKCGNLTHPIDEFNYYVLCRLLCWTLTWIKWIEWTKLIWHLSEISWDSQRNPFFIQHVDKYLFSSIHGHFIISTYISWNIISTLYIYVEK